MLIFTTVQALKKYLKSQKQLRKKIGFVPTMGALHQGHISLIKQSLKRSQLTVCSIFVNPTQFNDPEDFKKYPITLESDINHLKKAGCHVLFAPSVKEIYPQGLSAKKSPDFGFLAETLEGEHRPGHFAGMAQVVERLLRITTPDLLFMGLKDYQQQLIVNELIKKKKLPVKLIACETRREKDGLAMSSRNVRLSPTDRKNALGLSKALKLAVKLYKSGKELSVVNDAVTAELKRNKAIGLEYFEIRNASTLKTPKRRNEKLVALIAAQVGGVRLIDNMHLN